MKVVPSQLRHGYAKRGAVHPVHRVWRMMLDRCYNTKNKRYKSYGGRGIKVHVSWHKFENFIADVGERPPGKGKGGRARYSIEREDNDGDYEPGNVVWATASTQVNNSRKVLNRRAAACHPERRHYSRGMCGKCYRHWIYEQRKVS